MWITKNYSGKIQQEYKIESKLLEIKGIRHNLEIFNSKTFESIALIDEQIFLKTMLALQSELLAHICACSHQEPKRVLIADNFNLELAFEFLRYSELKVDFLQFDLKILESLISFFPHYQEVMKNANFKLIPQQQEEFLEQNEQRASLYDIIIATDESQFHCYKKLLNEDGILVLKISLAFLETPHSRRIKCFFYDGMIRIGFEEEPGLELIQDALASVTKTGGSVFVQGLFAKLDPEYVKYKIKTAVETEVIGQIIE